MSRVSRVSRVALVLVGSLIALPALGQGSAVVTGTVTDASTNAPISDVVVTATSPALQGEQIVVTDATGSYRIPQLPAGTYTLRYEKEGYRPYSRADIGLRTDRTTRVNVQMLPEALQAQEVVVVGRAPTVDVGTSSTGVSVSEDFINNIAVVRPGGKNSAQRSFESLAEIAPGAFVDDYGVSISGTTSPENQYVIDGLSVNDPAFGILGTPLSVEFVKEVNVTTGGYMPEFGRATGGILNVVTKSGSNEFHGSVWANYTPGALEAKAKEVVREGGSIGTRSELWNQGDFGAELGGPIMKDKLWFYAGFQPSFNREALNRQISRRVACTAEDFASGAFGCSQADGQVTRLDEETGFSVLEPLEGTQRRFFADARAFQYIGKLTYLINQDHNVSLTINGQQGWAGGDGSFGFDQQGGFTEVGNIIGTYDSIAHRYDTNARDISLKYSGAFMDKRALIDITAGWHNQFASRLPSDGSEIGSSEGLAGIPQVIFRSPHTITDFESIPDPSLCESTFIDEDGNPQTVDLCPVSDYFTGGPGFLSEARLDRYQAKIVGTYLLNLLGHHVIKAGFDVENLRYDSKRAYSGLLLYQETANGLYWNVSRSFGYLSAPDTPVFVRTFESETSSTTVGGFLQDSWSVMDLFTLNIGVRYDQQTLTGGTGETAFTLGNQWSPRVGVIYDFTQEGRSKIFANFARFYENVPINLLDRQFPSESQIFARAYKNPNEALGRPGCDPLDPEQNAPDGSCLAAENLFPYHGNFWGPYMNDLFWRQTGGETTPVDPSLKPQSSDEIVVGGEYEIFNNARVGATYTHRYMNHVIEDMSRDDANTYFIGNPGYGIARDFPKATRDYDAVTVYFDKTFADLWLAQASYTWSRLHGNYAGLYRPETGQLDPNGNSTFDLISLLANNTGPLPGDRTHAIKLFGAKEFVISGTQSVNLGLSYRTRSGTPLNYLGTHEIYGSDEVFILPRGSAGRLPWRHDVDGHLGYTFRITKDNAVTLSADVFNLFNFQEVVSVDETYTTEAVLPVPEGTPGSNDEKLAQVRIAGTDETLVGFHPNFKNPTAYQAPRVVRFGAKISF